MGKRHLTLRIYGQVQGVFFRQSALEKAEDLGICGFVRNEPNGSVYLEAEGEPDALDQLKSWCRQGPEMASVTRVDVGEGGIKGYSEFEIRR